jgi:hypothetical protein
LQDGVSHPPAIAGLLPLIRDNARYTLAMMKHGMKLLGDATHHVNPGQVPVLTVDQQLYCIAKQIQWSWPHIWGEGKYVHS